MIFILAPDSFKESMTAQQACLAMERGIKKVMPQAICVHAPLADGGEGTLQTLVNAVGGEIFRQKVRGPLGYETTGEFAILSDAVTGVVELASASGLHLVPLKDRNPLITTTFGTGELIKAVVNKGVKKLIVAIGGSSTNDGGAGIAQALGVRFLNDKGNEIGYGGEALLDIVSIDTSQLITKNKDIDVEIACDVINPLTGPHGAAQVYGPQKGATAEMIIRLDHALVNYANRIKECTGKEVEKVAGAGSGGGAGAGMMAFLDAKLVKGIDIMMLYSGLAEKIKSADYVFTAEGSIDYQTAYGKAISGVARLAMKYNKPVIAFGGKIGNAQALCQQIGLTSIFGILPTVCSLDEALQSGIYNLENTVYSVVQIIDYLSYSHA